MGMVLWNLRSPGAFQEVLDELVERKRRHVTDLVRM